MVRVVAALSLVLLAAGCAGPTASPGSLGSDPAPSPPASAPGGPRGSPGSGAGSPGTTPGAAATPPTKGSWARLEIDGPAPAAREDHTWTVDESGGSAYLFGGRDGGIVLDDLWRFELATNAWERLSVPGAGPAARFGHEGAWVTGRGLVVWAGQAGATFFDDLWLFDPSAMTWQRLPAGGLVPAARYGSCSGIGPDGRLWISHGFTADGSRYADTEAYDFGTGAWADQGPPGVGPVERCLHACWWTSDGRLALYGGQTTGVAALGDLWFLTPGPGGEDTNAWTMAPTPALAARQLAAVTRHGSLTVVFGGRGRDGDPLRDTWLLADGAPAFTPIETTGGDPRARSGAALVHDRSRDRLFLFGGLGNRAFDDLWELRLSGGA